MSTNMDGSDLPSATNAGHVGHVALQSADSAQPESVTNTSEPDLLHQLAAMRARLDAAHSELAGARLQIERLQAAALAPCPRCNFHADWSVRVQSSMGGQVHTIACPDGPATLITHIKRELALCDPKWSIPHLLVLFLPFDASGRCSSSDADLANPAPLADDRTLASCGVSNGHLLELLVADMDWNDENRLIFEKIQQCGRDAIFTDPRFFEDGAALAVSWALVNSVYSIVSVHGFD
jgi:hypothetical protein